MTSTAQVDGTVPDFSCNVTIQRGKINTNNVARSDVLVAVGEDSR